MKNGQKGITKIFVAVVVVILLVGGYVAYELITPRFCCSKTDTKGSKTIPPIFGAGTISEGKLMMTAKLVIAALWGRDYQTLQGLVSSDGLSLDKEPHFDSVKNLIPQNEVSSIAKDTQVHMWGYTDGKGDPINLTRAQFIEKFIYNNTIDYLKAPDIAVNKTLGSGNSLNTIDKDADGCIYVAFHFDGFDEKYAGMDWTTLYLIFDTKNGEYKLRGIAKDNWTI